MMQFVQALKPASKKVIKKPVFQITPDQCILYPYQSQIITISGYSEGQASCGTSLLHGALYSPQDVTETMICSAVLGHNPHKEKIMTVHIDAQFITPLVQFSTKHISFYIEQVERGEGRQCLQPILLQVCGAPLTKHTKTLSLTGVSLLPLTVVLSCGYPFAMWTQHDATPHTVLVCQYYSQFPW